MRRKLGYILLESNLEPSVAEILEELENKTWKFAKWWRLTRQFPGRVVCAIKGHKTRFQMWRSENPNYKKTGNYQFHWKCCRCSYYRVEKPPEIKMIDETPYQDLPLLIGNVEASIYLEKRIKSGK